MGELTIEAKAKAYDYAVNKAKELILNENGVVRVDKPLFDELFPSEMEESEDERIRKALIKGFNECLISSSHYPENAVKYWHGIVIDDILAWLEKQGEHANFRNKIQIGDKVTRNEGGVLVNISQLNRVAKERKKQGGEQILANSAKTCKDEQKPNPYSGTSFDYDGHTWGMCARDNGVELLLDGELKAFLSLEKSFIYPIHPQPELAPKSALEAAKEEKVDNANKVEPKDYNDIDPHFGKPIDKVVPKFNVDDWIIDNNIKTPFQITGISNEKYDVISIYGTDMAFSSREVEYFYHLWTINDAKDGDVLATDDWVFIFEKVNDDKTIHCYCHYDCDEDMQAFNVDTDYHMVTGGTINPATKEQRDLLFAKMKEAGYVWLSGKKRLVKLLFKEGDTVRKKLDGSIWHINYINEHGYLGNHKPLFPIENQNEFELVEKKPWSEEDRKNYQMLQKIICDSDITANLANKLSDWLKDLKDRVQPQNTWKPSDKQMNTLEYYMHTLVCNEHKEILFGLYTDLKKLREE